MAELTDYQRDIIIRTVLGEARGEGDVGMAAVAHNIRNRSLSGKFPSDPAKVALQDKQYSVWNDGAGGGKTNYSKGSELYQRAGQLVDGVFGGQIADMTGGALYYHTPSVTPHWADAVNKHGTSRIGNHIFYHGRPVPPEELPQVATLTDTIPVRGIPVTMSPDLQKLRNAPRLADVPIPQKRPQTAMDVLRVANLDNRPKPDWVDSIYADRAVKTPGAISSKDLIFDDGVTDVVKKSAEIQMPDLAAALAGYIDRGQSGQQKRRNATPAEVAAAGQGAWTVADGPLVSTRKQSSPSKPAPGQSGLVGADRGPFLRATPAPKRTAAELAAIYQGGGPTRPNQAPSRNATAAQIAAAGQGGMPFSAADGPATRLDTAPRLSTKKPMPGQSGSVLQNSEPMPAGAPKPRPLTERPRQQTYAGQETGTPITIAPKPAPLTQKPRPQTYAGQETTTGATNRLPIIGPTGGPPLPNNAPKPAPLTQKPRPQSYAGQDAAPTSGAPKPATQSIDLAIRRSPGGEVVSTVPSNPNIGQPPTKKIVQGIPIAGGVPVKTQAQRMAEIYQYGGPSQGLANAPRLAGTTIPGPNSPIKTEERLTAGVYPKPPIGNATTLADGIQVVKPATQTAGLTRNVELPRARPRLEIAPMGGPEVAVATQLDVVQPGLPPSGTGPLSHGTLRTGTDGKTYAWHLGGPGGGQWQLFTPGPQKPAPQKPRGGIVAGLGGLGQIGNLFGGLLAGAPRLGGTRSGPSDYFLAATGMTDSGISENHRTPSIGVGK